MCANVHDDNWQLTLKGLTIQAQVIIINKTMAEFNYYNPDVQLTVI